MAAKHNTWLRFFLNPLHPPRWHGLLILYLIAVLCGTAIMVMFELAPGLHSPPSSYDGTERYAQFCLVWGWVLAARRLISIGLPLLVAYIVPVVAVGLCYAGWELMVLMDVYGDLFIFTPFAALLLVLLLWPSSKKWKKDSQTV